ncbi:hypothetical protein CC79DRAFT_830354 [Sarocladium strictum]
MARIAFLFVVLLSLLVTLASASAPVFCKCTCNKNSTIIPLDPNAANSPSSLAFLFPRDHDGLTPKAPGATTCSQCTKAFCLGQNLDICKDAQEEDVVTLCFKRDSIKDRIIVWAFTVGTVGLLGWALFKRFRQWREERRDAGYAPMPVGGR